MEEFQYKEYSEEENKIYQDAMRKIMEGLKNGLNFAEACNDVDVSDAELKGFITDDALKIVIADMHYNKGLGLADLASLLNISLETAEKANREMLEDVSLSSEEIHRLNNPDNRIGNA